MGRISVAAEARIAVPPAGAAHTDTAGLACHQTHLFTYRGESRLAADALEDRLEPSDPAFAGVEAATGWPLASGLTGTGAPVVSAQAAKFLREVAGLAADGIAQAANPYDRERWTRIEAWCMHREAPDVAYRRRRIGDLAASVVASGAEAAVFDAGGRLLLIRRTDTGQWAMPGGAAELGETIAKTAVRETVEECGLAVETTGIVGVFDNREAFANVRIPIIATFLARPLSFPPQLRLDRWEAEEAVWVDEEQSRSLEYFRGHERRVPAAFAAAST